MTADSMAMAGHGVVGLVCVLCALATPDALAVTVNGCDIRPVASDPSLSGTRPRRRPARSGRRR